MKLDWASGKKTKLNFAFSGCDRSTWLLSPLNSRLGWYSLNNSLHVLSLIFLAGSRWSCSIAMGFELKHVRWIAENAVLGCRSIAFGGFRRDWNLIGLPVSTRSIKNRNLQDPSFSRRAWLIDSRWWMDLGEENAYSRMLIDNLARPPTDKSVSGQTLNILNPSKIEESTLRVSATPDRLRGFRKCVVPHVSSYLGRWKTLRERRLRRRKPNTNTPIENNLQ